MNQPRKANGKSPWTATETFFCFFEIEQDFFAEDVVGIFSYFDFKNKI